MRVLVTGAAGFIGRRLCEELVADGHRVRGLVRSLQHDTLPHVDIAHGDITDPDAVADSMSGMDAVVHLAARVHVMHETAGDPIVEFRRVNVFGTRIVRDAAVAAGVKCFIFVSSVKAVGEQSIQPWTSKTLPQPLDAYGMSKLEAEQLFTNTAFTTINPTIVRLPLVYGPGVQGNVLRLFNAVQRGVPIPVGLARNARSMVYVGNVTAAIRLALESPDGKPTRIAPTPFFLSDGPAISTESLVRMIARALGRKAHLTRIPIPVLRGVANIADRLLVVLSDVPRLTPAIDRLVGSLEVDGTEFERVFSFTPPFSLEQGLESTARWFMSTSTAG